MPRFYTVTHNFPPNGRTSASGLFVLLLPRPPSQSLAWLCVYYIPRVVFHFLLFRRVPDSRDRPALFAVDLPVRNLIMRAQEAAWKRKFYETRTGLPRLAREGGGGGHRTPLFYSKQNCTPAWCTVTGRFFFRSTRTFLASLKRPAPATVQDC